MKELIWGVRVQSAFGCSAEKAPTKRSLSLFIQGAKHMRRNIFSSVASAAVQYFSTVSHKDFRKIGPQI